MHRTLAPISSLAALACAAGAMQCSSSPPSAPSPTCGSNNVSFSKDVIPAFQMRCTMSNSCHGQMNQPLVENLYLGLYMGGGTTADVKAVYRGLVGVLAKEDPSMNLVTKGDLQNSYLWHKVNDDQPALTQGTLATGCKKASTMCLDCSSSAPCGGTMPYLSDSLATIDSQSLCAIQSWIQQGALNN
jgi:hypothetical protein